MAAGRWLVAGLGNPGAAYRGTIHNAGREVVEQLARRLKVEWREKGKALVADCATGHLMLPETFMNLSGEAVAAFARRKFYAPDRILVVVDDVYVLAGRVRVRREGSDGGHNGLASIEASLGTRAYPRIRIGAGPDPGGAHRTDYVLGRPRPEIAAEFFEGKEKALLTVETAITRGLEAAMEFGNA